MASPVNGNRSGDGPLSSQTLLVTLTGVLVMLGGWNIFQTAQNAVELSSLKARIEGIERGCAAERQSSIELRRTLLSVEETQAKILRLFDPKKE